MKDNSKPPEGKEVKPARLYFKTYIQLVKNSVGTGMFRNFYVLTESEGEFDALDNGSNACAFYVSGVLTMFGNLAGVHGTIISTIKDLEASGWRPAEKAEAGDVIVWEAEEFADGRYEHIGFCVEAGKATSVSCKSGRVVEHDLCFGEPERPIKQLFRLDDWDN